MVVGGTVTATLSAGVQLSQAVNVSSRQGFNAVTLPAPQLVNNGATVNGMTLPMLTSPPDTSEGSLGQSLYAFSFQWQSSSPQSGPNTGLHFISSFTDSSAFAWELNPGLTDPNDAFYQHQGNCFASISQIVSAVQSHEVGTLGPSHYSEVQAALANNNPATVAAGLLKANDNDFDNDIRAVYQSAFSAGTVEPPTNLPPNINYPPYGTCP